MKLRDLDPRWVVKDGLRVGFIFKSPTDAQWYQFCKFIPIERSEQWRLFEEALGEDLPEDWKGLPPVQGAKESFSWTCTPDPESADFDSLTIHPSIDGSPGGLWHGWIRNGEIC
jgi:hypothetical protein